MNKIKEIIKINKKTRQITYTELIRKKITINNVKIYILKSV